MTQLIDNFQRQFRYLRLSVTEACNFRCQYCLPNGYHPVDKTPFLSLPEIRRVVTSFAALGVTKIRLTGGEPTMRRDFPSILRVLQENSAIQTTALTTNGYRLYHEVAHWQMLGLTAVNVSVDSLNPAQFHQITGQNKLHSILRGIDRALEIGIPNVKINVVLMKSLNDSLDDYLRWIKDKPLQLRFIELMETGLGRTFFREHHVSGQQIRARLLEQGWQQKIASQQDGPALVFSHPDYVGEIGLIMPYDASFCDSCNRLRVSSLGKLHLCLFGEAGIMLRDLLGDDADQDALKARIVSALGQKRKTHFLHQNDTGITQNLSFIGG